MCMSDARSPATLRHHGCVVRGLKRVRTNTPRGRHLDGLDGCREAAVRYAERELFGAQGSLAGPRSTVIAEEDAGPVYHPNLRSTFVATRRRGGADLSDLKARLGLNEQAKKEEEERQKAEEEARKAAEAAAAEPSEAAPEAESSASGDTMPGTGAAPSEPAPARCGETRSDSRVGPRDDTNRCAAVSGSGAR